jgi:uncharacterized membrane protein
MPTSTDPNDALTEISLMKDSNAGCTTEHVSNTQYVSFQVDTHTNNHLEGCSYSATNIYMSMKPM